MSRKTAQLRRLHAHAGQSRQSDRAAYSNYPARAPNCIAPLASDCASTPRPARESGPGCRELGLLRQFRLGTALPVRPSLLAGLDRQLGRDDGPLVCADGILARAVSSEHSCGGSRSQASITRPATVTPGDYWSRPPGTTIRPYRTPGVTVANPVGRRPGRRACPPTRRQSTAAPTVADVHHAQEEARHRQRRDRPRAGWLVLVLGHSQRTRHDRHTGSVAAHRPPPLRVPRSHAEPAPAMPDPDE